MATSDQHITVLVGPTCPTCASDDLRWGAPLGALWHGQCRDCGTEYRWYEAPDDLQPQPTCPGCGLLAPTSSSRARRYCEDCEPSDCAYCGVTTLRFDAQREPRLPRVRGRGGRGMTTSPRIYVACLAAYNAGHLHGRWIDADQSADDIWDDVRGMLRTSPENATCQWCGAVMLATSGPIRWDKPCTHGEHLPGNPEEWAIHDYEGFGPLRLSEWESFERVSAIAAGIEEHGMAFAAWLSYDESREADDVEAFESAYCGEWKSLHEYAEQYADDMGLYDAAEKCGSPYVTVDIDALERDLDIEMYTVDSDHYTVYVFDPAAS